MSSREVVERRERMIPNPQNSELMTMQLRLEELGQQLNSLQTQVRNVGKSLGEFVAEVNKVMQSKDAKIRELQVPIKKDIKLDGKNEVKKSEVKKK